MRLNKYQNKLLFEYKTIIEECKKAEDIFNQSTNAYGKLEKDYKRLISMLSIKQLSQIPTEKEQEMIHGFDIETEKQVYQTNVQSSHELPGHIEELEHIEDNICNYLFNTYMEIYQEKKKALLSLVNFAPAVQNAISKVSNYWKYFENERSEIESIYMDIEKLTIWYENFRNAYDKFEAELWFRRDYEIKANENVRIFSEKLNADYSVEFKRRIKFNEDNAKFLPENLKILLDDPPIRYIVYPQMLNFSGSYKRNRIQIESESIFASESNIK